LTHSSLCLRHEFPALLPVFLQFAASEIRTDGVHRVVEENNEALAGDS
jgi:hypothetical protein